VDEAAHQGSPAVTAGDESRDPEQIREDIERTRREVADTAAALAEKADVKAQARAKVDEIKGRVSDKAEETVGKAKQAAPDSAGGAASTVSVQARQNKLPLIIAGAALAGFLLGRALAKR
jgi:hypothetical protein